MVTIKIVVFFPPQRDMLDVSQIMKDLASMVHEQGDTIGKCLCRFSYLFLEGQCLTMALYKFQSICHT